MMGETEKAHERRLREGWFEKYAPAELPGIDIGCATDPLNHTFRRWDYIRGDSDATQMAGVPDDVFQTVYASHILEHLNDPVAAIKNWYRICRSGGNLIICVPHRDLYEQKKELPSIWNHDHKFFYLPEIGELPITLSLRQMIEEAIPEPDVISFRILDEGYSKTGGGWVDGFEHPAGEFSIEAIIRKI